MNSTLLVLLIGCSLLQQAFADLPLKSSDDAEKNPLKYYPPSGAYSSGGSYSHSPEYLSSLPKYGSAFGSPDYFICRKTIFNSYEPVDLMGYSNSASNRVSLRRSDRLAKRFQNNNLYPYKMDSYQDELLPKPTRKSDDPKIFRNLFLGSRG